MKGRTIKADILLNKAINSLSSFEEVTYYHMRVAADSKGFLPDDAGVLIGKLFPMRSTIRLDQMEKCVANLLKSGLIVRKGKGIYVACMMKEDAENDTYCADFHAFYSAYPKKVNKQEAQDVWKALKLDENTFKKVMEALEAHKKCSDWRKENGKYIPNPAKWLRRKRWEDQLDLPFTDKPPESGIVDADDFFGNEM